MHPRRCWMLPVTLIILNLVGRISSQAASDNSLSTAPPPISVSDSDGGLDPVSSINTGDDPPTDTDLPPMSTSAGGESYAVTSLGSDSTTSMDNSQSTSTDTTVIATPMSTTDSEMTSTTTQTSSSPSTFITSTSTTPGGSAKTSTSQPGWQTNSSQAAATSKNTIAPGGIIAISILLALMVGAGGYILWRAFRSHRSTRVLEKQILGKSISSTTSFTPSDHTAAVPLFSESARSSGEAFSPTTANALPGSTRFPLEYDKPLPAPPSESSKKGHPRLLTKGKRPMYNTPMHKISTSQSSRPSPLRRQFSFDLEDAANNEVLRSAGLTPPTSALPANSRGGPLTSNPVDDTEIRRLSAVSTETGSPRNSLDSLPESLRVRPGSV